MGIFVGLFRVNIGLFDLNEGLAFTRKIMPLDGFDNLSQVESFVNEFFG